MKKEKSRYSNSEPILTEGDIFEIRIPIISNEANMKLNEANDEANMKLNEAKHNTQNVVSIEDIYDRIKENPQVTQTQLAQMLKVSRSTIQRATKELSEQG